MTFLVGSCLYYHAFEPATVVCSLSCQRSERQRVSDESLTIDRDVTRADLIVGLEANRLVRFEVPTPGNVSVGYQATVDTSPTVVDMAGIRPGSSSAFEPLALPYLYSSRYAPADRLRFIAYDLFGSIREPVAQILAIEDWLHENVTYVTGTSNEQSWCLDTFETRSGVCRDFAHLGIAFCRALTIPARYVTVYAYGLSPQDFHAVVEVYIDGSWYVIDGTRKAPLNGMVRVATGRDASDAAVANLFGNIQGQGIHVWSQLTIDGEDQFTPITREGLLQEDKILVLS